MMFDSNGDITPPLRDAFTGRPKETDIDMSRLDSFPQQSHETCVADPAAYGLHQQSMMYAVSK